MASQDPTQLRVDSDSQTQRGILRVLNDWWTNGVAFPNAVSTPANGYVGGGDAAWINVLGGVGFTNSWVNLGTNVARFRKLPSGLVIVEGQIKSGTNGLVAFTLPAGYQPGTGFGFGYIGYDVFTAGALGIQITGAGAVIPSAGSGDGIDIHCVFYAGA